MAQRVLGALDACEPLWPGAFSGCPGLRRSRGDDDIVCPRRSQRRSNHGCVSRTRAWREPGTRGNHRGGCMSNTHGHLPKAERAQLPAELQQRLEAWTTKAYTDDNLFLTLARSPGVLEMFLHWAAFMYTGISRLDPSTMELCRLRLAARNHCVH